MKTGKEFLPSRIDIFDHSLPNEAKDTTEYGLAWGRHIEKEWDMNSSNGEFATTKARLKEIKSHMVGDVDLKKYKPIFGVDKNDQSYLSLNWKFPSIVSKYVNLVSNGIEDNIFYPSVSAVDGKSIAEKRSVKEGLQNKRYGRKFTEEFKKTFGEEYGQGDSYTPETDEEVDVYMDNFKTATEAASEIAIEKFYDINNFQEVIDKVKKDLTAYRKAIVSIKKDSGKGIAINRVDPYNFIQSPDLENSNDKRGSYYFAQVKKMTIGDVRSASDGDLTEDQIKTILMSKNYRDINPNDEAIDDILVDVMYFTFKTTNRSVYKKKYNSYGGVKMIKKESYWQPQKLHNFEVVTSEYDVWYHGDMILGTDIVYNYNKNPNIARDPENIGIAYPPFVVYELDTESIAEKIIPYAENIYTTYIKLQQLILSARPKGYLINIDALQNIDLGSSGVLEPIDQIEVYEQTGRMIYSGTDIIGDPSSSGGVISDGLGGIPGDLQQLITAYNHYLDQIESVSGINKIRDGSTPSAKAAVGVQKMSLAASNNATKYIYNGFLSIYKNTSALLLRFIQTYSKNDQIKKKIQSAIGYKNIDTLERLYDIDSRSFVVSVDISMNEQEKQMLYQDVQIAIEARQIDITDKIDIMSSKNIKYANLMLKAKKKARAVQAQKMAQARQQAQRQEAMINMQMEAKKMAQEKQMDFQMEQKGKNMDLQRDIKMQEMENKLFKIKRKIESHYKMLEIAAQAKASMGSVKYKEDRTDQRANQEDENDSRKIEQRQKNTGSLKFPKEKGLFG